MMSTWCRRALLVALAGAATPLGCGARGTPPPADPASGRFAGSRVLHHGGQSTVWLLYCPTESPSPLRGTCSYVRADDPAAGVRQGAAGEPDERGIERR
jgi:hypothetical protein